jgi:hypothetical protein
LIEFARNRVEEDKEILVSAAMQRVEIDLTLRAVTTPALTQAM